MITGPPRIPGRRWIIGVLLGVGVLVNYIDRINLSVAAPQLQEDFNLSPEELGLLFSAFFWSYSLLQVPGGMVLDRFGVTRVGRWGAFLWAVASAITAISSGFGGIFAARVLLGVAEAPAFPASQKATGYWFPRNERSRSTAIFDSAAKFSNVIGVPLVAFAIVNLGWRWGFGITAVLSLGLLRGLLADLSRPERGQAVNKARTRLHPSPEAPRRKASPAGGNSAMLGYLSAQQEGLGSHHRLLGLRLFVLSVPHMAARLPGADAAHEHPEIGGLHDHSLDLRKPVRSADRRLPGRSPDRARAMTKRRSARRCSSPACCWA